MIKNYVTKSVVANLRLKILIKDIRETFSKVYNITFCLWAVFYPQMTTGTKAGYGATLIAG